MSGGFWKTWQYTGYPWICFIQTGYKIKIIPDQNCLYTRLIKSWHQRWKTFFLLFQWQGKMPCLVVKSFEKNQFEQASCLWWVLFGSYGMSHWSILRYDEYGWTQQKSWQASFKWWKGYFVQYGSAIVNWRKMCCRAVSLQVSTELLTHKPKEWLKWEKWL